MLQLIDIRTDDYRPGRFVADIRPNEVENLQLRDYRALLPYLKKGVSGQHIDRLNAREEYLKGPGGTMVRPADLTLTVDANLQRRLGDELAEFMPRMKSGIERLTPLRRASVVILDASDGDLLASANYPLVSQGELVDFYAKNAYYSDNNMTPDKKVLADRDLALLSATAPGSTAKVMSAIAGVKGKGVKAATSSDFNFRMRPEELVGADKKISALQSGRINMEQALVWSSNTFFIKLINGEGTEDRAPLYNELRDVYAAAGISLKGKTPYAFGSFAEPAGEWIASFDADVDGGSAKYWDYVDNYAKKGDYRMLNRGVSYGKKGLYHPGWAMTWGQGDISATPLAIARVASAVVNDGSMPVTRFVVDGSEPRYVEFISSSEAEVLRGFMEEEARVHTAHKITDYPSVGGKTGTAERTHFDKNIPAYGRKGYGKPNDGWYMFYVDKASVPSVDEDGTATRMPHHLAVCIRIERGVGSPIAKLFAKDKVLPLLKELGYIPRDSEK